MNVDKWQKYDVYAASIYIVSVHHEVLTAHVLNSSENLTKIIKSNYFLLLKCPYNPPLRIHSQHFKIVHVVVLNSTHNEIFPNMATGQP